MSQKVLVGVTDLVLSSRILQIAMKSDVDVDIEKSHAGVLELAEETHPDLIILDLDSKRLESLQLVRELRNSEHGNRARIVAYQSYFRPELRHEALAAGCDLVLTRSQFCDYLPEILRGRLELLEAADGRTPLGSPTDVGRPA